jgi:hypothetical protein
LESQLLGAHGATHERDKVEDTNDPYAAQAEAMERAASLRIPAPIVYELGHDSTKDEPTTAQVDVSMAAAEIAAPPEPAAFEGPETNIAFVDDVDADHGDKAPDASGDDKVSTKRSTGFVDVVASNGWADVYLGTRKLGRTPLRVWLPTGGRVLRFQPYGKGPSFGRRVAISAGKPAQLKLPIK